MAPAAQGAQIAAQKAQFNQAKRDARQSAVSSNRSDNPETFINPSYNLGNAIKREEALNKSRTLQTNVKQQVETFAIKQARNRERIRTATSSPLSDFSRVRSEEALSNPYQTEPQAMRERVANTPVEQPGRASILRASKQLAQSAQEAAISKAKEMAAIKAKKIASRFLWNAGGLSTTAETEGIAAWTVSGAGLVAQMYRVFKLILNPDTGKSLDSGQFFKGVLANFEPRALDAKDPLDWLSGLHAGFGYFFLIAMIHIVIATMIIYAMIVAGTFSVLGGLFGSFSL
ncbi:MAG: hypothetical protein O3B64_00570 [bacterium]|nr:hypothetical protein [bacterium]